MQAALKLIDNITYFEPVHTKAYGVKKEVYPFKSQADIDKMARHFLDQAKVARRMNHPQDFKDALRNYLFFMMGINTGLRASDLCRLRWCDIFTPDYEFIDSPYFYITEKKTSKQRYLHLNADIKRVIKWYLIQIQEPNPSLDSYVFTSRKSRNRPIPTGTMSDMITDAGRAINLPYRVSTHSLRKTFGYRLYTSSGKSPDALVLLQKVFGHSSPAITLRYIGMDIEEIYSAYDRVTGTALSNEELDASLKEEDIND